MNKAMKEESRKSFTHYVDGKGVVMKIHEKRKTQTSLFLSDREYEALKGLAEKQGRFVSQLVRELIFEAFDRVGLTEILNAETLAKLDEEALELEKKRAEAAEEAVRLRRLREEYEERLARRGRAIAS